MQIGRQKFFGIGLESTPGTKASVISYFPFDAGKLGEIVESGKVESGIGRRESVSDSFLAKKRSEANIDGKVRDALIGILLKAGLGSLTTTGDDPEAGVNTHDFSVLNSAAIPTLTIVVVDEFGARMTTGAKLNSISFQVDKGEALTFSASFIGNAAESTTETPTISAGNLLLARTATLKRAADISGLDGASAFSFDSFDLEFSNNLSANGVQSDGNPDRIVAQNFTASASAEAVFSDAGIRTDFLAHAGNAVRIEIESVATIGAATNPKLRFDFAKTRFENHAPSDDLDGEIRQSFDISPEYDATSGKLLSAQLVNTIASY
jgi:hypothetical protein